MWFFPLARLSALFPSFRRTFFFRIAHRLAELFIISKLYFLKKKLGCYLQTTYFVASCTTFTVIIISNIISLTPHWREFIKSHLLHRFMVKWKIFFYYLVTTHHHHHHHWCVWSISAFPSCSLRFSFLRFILPHLFRLCGFETFFIIVHFKQKKNNRSVIKISKYQCKLIHDFIYIYIIFCVKLVTTCYFLLFYIIDSSGKSRINTYRASEERVCDCCTISRFNFFSLL